MNLAGTTTLLQALAEMEHQPQGQGEDQRRWRRIPVRGEAELHTMDRSRTDRTPLDIALRDISRTGIGFVSTVPVQMDSLWCCCFLKNGHVVSQQGLMVRHCRQVDDGIFLIGGQFVLDSATLEMLDAVSEADTD